MLVITGASGMVGGPAIRNLIAHGQVLRALSSSAESARRLQLAGVHETVIGNFRNTGDLQMVMRGAHTVVHIPPSVVPDEDRIGFDVIAAARATGVGHFVFISCFHPQIADLRHHRNKLAVEDALIKSGLTYTILQPAMFMQNLRFIWAGVERGIFEWPWDPNRLYAMLDTEDLGAVIARVADESRFRGGTYELCSGDAISGLEMARSLSDAMHKTIVPGRMNPETWAAGMSAAGVPEWTVKAVLGMCRFHDVYGYGGGSSVVLEAILGRPARRYRDFAESVARHGSPAGRA